MHFVVKDNLHDWSSPHTFARNLLTAYSILTPVISEGAYIVKAAVLYGYTRAE